MEADFHTLLMFSWHFQMLKRFNVIIRPTINLLAMHVYVAWYHHVANKNGK